MITTIFFDCWGVLAHKRMRLFDSISADLGLDESAHLYFYARFKQAQLGKLSEADFWRDFRRHFRIDSQLVVTPWVKHYQRISTIDRVVCKLAGELHRQGYRTGILSNIDPQAVEFIRAAGVTQSFDLEIYSCEVGSEKPDATIYYAALKAAKVEAAQTLFIDDKADNIAAAEALGMRGIVFETVAQLRRELVAALSLVAHDTKIPGITERAKDL